MATYYDSGDCAGEPTSSFELSTTCQGYGSGIFQQWSCSSANSLDAVLTETGVDVVTKEWDSEGCAGPVDFVSGLYTKFYEQCNPEPANITYADDADPPKAIKCDFCSGGDAITEVAYADVACQDAIETLVHVAMACVMTLTPRRPCQPAAGMTTTTTTMTTLPGGT